jgi:putative hemolysin
MDFSTIFGLVAVVVLVFANGFFVATEFAIVAVRRSRLDELVRDGRAGAAAASEVVNHLDAYIAATQFGITLASLALGWIGEPVLAHLLEPALTAVVGGFAPAAAHGTAIAIAFALITGLHIVFGELAPKGLALQRPEATSIWVARPIQAFYIVFKWPISALNAIGNGTLRLAGLRPASGHEMVHSVEELRLLVTGMQQAGVVDEAEAQIARRAFAFGELTAGALMTPRTEVEALSVDATFPEVMRKVEQVPYRRLPVFERTVDNIVGILDVLLLFKLRDAPPDGFVLRPLLAAPVMVPETMYGADLLQQLRDTRASMAIVVDEYGGTAGIVTLSNLFEALVGSVESGPDLGTADGKPAQANDGSMLFDGLTRIDEFGEVVGVRFEDETTRGLETLGGMVAAILGRMPQIGDEIELGGRRLRVEARDGLRVSSVRLLPLAGAAERTKRGTLKESHR